MTKEQQHRKTLAALVCLLLGYLYIETVFLPYFYPDRYVGKKNVEASIEKKKEEIVKKKSDEIDPKSFSEETIAPEIESPESVVREVTTVAKDFSYYPNDAELERAGSIQIETEKFELHLSLLGGRVSNLLLKEHRAEVDENSGLLDLVSHVEGAPYPLGVYSADVNDAFVNYRLVRGPSPKDGRIKVDGKVELVFEGTLPDGRTIRKNLRFDKDSYMLGVDVLLSSAPASSSQLKLEWTQFVSEKDLGGLLDPYNTVGFSWFDGEAADRLNFGDLEDSKKEQLPDVSWVSLSDKYFIAALLAGGDKKAPSQLIRTGQLFRARLNGGEQAGTFALYLGPKSYKTLTDYGFELKRSIDFGFSGIIAAPLLELVFFFYGLFGNYGLSIIAITILVKFALYPLTVSQFKQMKGMQELAPEMKRIKESVKDAREQQAAIMQLYKKKGVNPFGGCLPMILQMPIFIGLYSALMIAVELRHAPFALWVVDLSAPEKFMMGGVGVPVMVILFVISMMVQQWITPSTADPAQKKMMMVMPLVFGFMFMNFPAGLTLYWLTNNLISIGQAQAAHRDMKKGQGVQITMGISLVIFLVAFVLTKL